MVGINVPIPVPMAYHSFGGWKGSLFGDLHVHGPDGSASTRGQGRHPRWPDPNHRGVDLGVPDAILSYALRSAGATSAAKRPICSTISASLHGAEPVKAPVVGGERAQLGDPVLGRPVQPARDRAVGDHAVEPRGPGRSTCGSRPAHWAACFDHPHTPRHLLSGEQAGSGSRASASRAHDAHHAQGPWHEPDPDRVRWERAELAVRGRGSARPRRVTERSPAPARAKDRDRLLERVDRLRTRAGRPAERGDPVPERAGARAELEPPRRSGRRSSRPPWRSSPGGRSGRFATSGKRRSALGAGRARNASSGEAWAGSGGCTDGPGCQPARARRARRRRPVGAGYQVAEASGTTKAPSSTVTAGSARRCPRRAGWRLWGPRRQRAVHGAGAAGPSSGRARRAIAARRAWPVCVEPALAAPAVEQVVLLPHQHLDVVADLLVGHAVPLLTFPMKRSSRSRQR